MATKMIAGAGVGGGLMALILSITTPNVEGLEGTKYRAYKDIGGVLTVCSGTTGPDVVVGKVYTPAECSKLTQRDLEKAADGILKYSPHLIWHPMQLAAAISYSYNAGVGRYRDNLAPIFNSGDLVAGCERLRTVTRTVNGVLTKGLINRREQEYKVCMSTLTPGGLVNVTVP